MTDDVLVAKIKAATDISLVIYDENVSIESSYADYDLWVAASEFLKKQFKEETK